MTDGRRGEDKPALEQAMVDGWLLQGLLCDGVKAGKEENKGRRRCKEKRYALEGAAFYSGIMLEEVQRCVRRACDGGQRAKKGSLSLSLFFLSPSLSPNKLSLASVVMGSSAHDLDQ